MTAARSDLAGLPDWPRGLSREQAAAYVGISVVLFDREVSPFVMSFQIGGRRLWDKQELDRWLDRRAKGSNDNETFDAALERLGAGDSRARHK